MRLSAIDIGSNAARLLIVEVIMKRSKSEFIKLNMLRIPLRLGFDVFSKGKIGREKRVMMLNMMRAFRALNDLYKVDAVKACATSAMRNADNSDSIIKEIKKETGIKIEVITGGKEANLLYQSHAAEKIDKNKTYLYVNVGGGSTELTVFAKGKPQHELSFEIGTIRILNNDIKESLWDNMKNEIKEIANKYSISAIIGTGGNINKVFSISKLKDNSPMTMHVLQSYYRKLSLLTTVERMKQFKLTQDRADVIVPALNIYLSVMQWSKVHTMYVPRVGLVDGIINALYNDL